CALEKFRSTVYWHELRRAPKIILGNAQPAGRGHRDTKYNRLIAGCKSGATFATLHFPDIARQRKTRQDRVQRSKSPAGSARFLNSLFTLAIRAALRAAATLHAGAALDCSGSDGARRVWLTFIATFYRASTMGRRASRSPWRWRSPRLPTVSPTLSRHPTAILN